MLTQKATATALPTAMDRATRATRAMAREYAFPTTHIGLRTALTSLMHARAFVSIRTLSGNGFGNGSLNGAGSNNKGNKENGIGNGSAKGNGNNNGNGSANGNGSGNKGNKGIDAHKTTKSATTNSARSGDKHGHAGFARSRRG